MVSNKRLTEASSSWWKWLISCWFLRPEVREIALQAEQFNRDLAKVKDDAHLLRVELEDMKSKIQKEAEAHKLSRDGNLALLRFIHTGHRLNVKFDPDSIRSALKRSNGQ